MFFRLWCLRILSALLLTGLVGCVPGNQGTTDEEKETYYLLGKKLNQERDFNGAIDAFERAIEVNPRSTLAHYELGLLYQQRRNDPATALYHYRRVLKLSRSEDQYPAVQTRDLIRACEQDILKAASLPTMDNAIVRDMEALKQENARLRQEAETLRGILASRSVGWSNPPVFRAPQPVSNAASLNPISNDGRQSQPPRPSVTTAPTGGRPSPQPATTDRTGILRPTIRTTPVNPSGNSARTPSGSASGSGASSGSSRSSGWMRSYTVRSGETLATVARKHNVSLSQLKAANPSVDPNRLRPGQVINVPSS